MTPHYPSVAALKATQTSINIDLRSDTVTQPSQEMRQVMAQAQVGDDVYGNDPNVNALEHEVAELLGKQTGLFLPSGTMSNLAAVLAHCQRGEEVVVGEQYHINCDEAAGVAVLGSVAMHALNTDVYGRFDLEQLSAAVKPNDYHCPMTRLLCLENTVSGCIQEQSHIDDLVERAKSHGLATHMDGARLLNAAVAQNLPPARLVESIDTVSLCLSKGLGVPLGSVLVGPRDVIERARRLRKMLGGGMRQAGIIAAAGRYALKHHVERLAEDHLRTQQLATALNGLKDLHFDQARVQTNMLFLQSPQMPALAEYLAERGIAITAIGQNTRIVLHMDIDDAALQQIIESIKAFFAMR
jgi:threonine aldolase